MEKEMALSKTEQKLMDRLNKSVRGVCEVVGVRERAAARSLAAKGLVAAWEPTTDKETKHGKTKYFFGGALYAHGHW